MRRVLAGGRDAIVTGAAGAQDLRVVNGQCRRKDIGVVTVLADVRGLQVRRTLAGRFDTVMAADAVTSNTDVIEIGG